MHKFIRIYEFARHIFADAKVAQQASQIIEGVMGACSPRLSDIAARTPGESRAFLFE